MASRSNMPQSYRGNMTNPVRDISRLQRNIDRILEEFLSPLPALLSADESLGLTPPCDIDEIDDYYLVTMDLPGMQKEQIRVEMRDNQLIVSAERAETRERHEGRRLNTERYEGSYTRVITLPASVASDKIEASYENGVLHIAIPKAEEAKARSVPIKEQKTGILNKLTGRQKEVKSERVA